METTILETHLRGESDGVNSGNETHGNQNAIDRIKTEAKMLELLRQSGVLIAPDDTRSPLEIAIRLNLIQESEIVT